jgi:hypothetical protein
MRFVADHARWMTWPLETALSGRRVVEVGDRPGVQQRFDASSILTNAPNCVTR